MKKILKIIVASLILLLGYKLMLPWASFPFEHFEYNVAKILPISWKFISIFSRLIIGIILITGFYLLLTNKKIPLLKYLSVLSISIPFIINPVFPKDWSDNGEVLTRNIEFKSNQNIEGTKLVAYFTMGCKFCKEAALKIDVAKKRSETFKDVLVISDNFELEKYFLEKELSFKLDTISFKNMLEVTRGSFPHFQLVKDGIVLKEWSNSEFNYAVLDNLSK